MHIYVRIKNRPSIWEAGDMKGLVGGDMRKNEENKGKGGGM